MKKIEAIEVEDDLQIPEGLSFNLDKLPELEDLEVLELIKIVNSKIKFLLFDILAEMERKIFEATLCDEDIDQEAFRDFKISIIDLVSKAAYTLFEEADLNLEFLESEVDASFNMDARIQKLFRFIEPLLALIAKAEKLLFESRSSIAKYSSSKEIAKLEIDKVKKMLEVEEEENQLECYERDLEKQETSLERSSDRLKKREKSHETLLEVISKFIFVELKSEADLFRISDELIWVLKSHNLSNAEAKRFQIQNGHDLFEFKIPLIRKIVEEIVTCDFHPDKDNPKRLDPSNRINFILYTQLALTILIFLGASESILSLYKNYKNNNDPQLSVAEALEKKLESYEMSGITFNFDDSFKIPIRNGKFDREVVEDILEAVAGIVGFFIDIPEGMEINLAYEKGTPALQIIYFLPNNNSFDPNELSKWENGLKELKIVDHKMLVSFETFDLGRFIWELMHVVRYQTKTYSHSVSFEVGILEYCMKQLLKGNGYGEYQKSIYQNLEIFLYAFPELKEIPLNTQLGANSNVIGLFESRQLIWGQKFEEFFNGVNRVKYPTFLTELQRKQLEADKEQWNLEETLDLANEIQPGIKDWFSMQKTFKMVNKEISVVKIIYYRKTGDLLTFGYEMVESNEEPGFFRMEGFQKPITIKLIMKSGEDLTVTNLFIAGSATTLLDLDSIFKPIFEDKFDIKDIEQVYVTLDNGTELQIINFEE